MNQSKLGSEVKDMAALPDASQSDVQSSSSPARQNEAAYQRIAHALQISSIAPSEELEKLVRTIEACCPTIDTLNRTDDG